MSIIRRLFSEKPYSVTTQSTPQAAPVKGTDSTQTSGNSPNEGSDSTCVQAFNPARESLCKKLIDSKEFIPTMVSCLWYLIIGCKVNNHMCTIERIYHTGNIIGHIYFSYQYTLALSSVSSSIYD